MADIVGTASAGHPNLNLTPDEKRIYHQLFKEADPDGFGAVSGDVAVKFFEKTKLAPEVLGQIWQIADTENRGFLTPSGFGVVLRLIGHAQAGRAPTPQIATQPAPIPRFDGGPQQLQPVSAQNSGAPASPSQAVPAPIRVPALTPEKVNEYSSLFEKSGAENGSLPGVVAKQIFERARLPNEVLGKIWNLSDMQSRGALDSTEFVIAMHLLASYKSSAMRGVPNNLPPGLYEAASRRRPVSFSRPGSGVPPPPPGVPQQFTGYANARPQSPLARQQVSTPLSAQSTGDGWAIIPTEKIRFDQIFNSLDKPGRGFITGDQAVEFFGNARLPEEILAQIWDLADINSEGQLNKDEFAVAMYLIKQQRGTKDGRGNLPATLPPALVPPSMRRQHVPPSQPTAPAFENATITQHRSAADDLFGLDAFAAQPVATAQVAQSTGGTDAGPFANPKSPPLAATSSPLNNFKPFIPSSSFGQSILPQSTGSTALQQSRGLAQSQTSDDLLGDADPEISQRLTSETSELANLSNQVGNLSKQMTEVQGSRAQAEQELTQSSQQKRDFEARLGQLRTQYEQEVKDVKALQTQLTTSRNDTKRLQQDYAMIEGTHHDLRTQHQQLSTALQADQQENASIKEKIRQMNAEIEQLKPQLEKLKSDARQQKGLVAINRKQLSTNEAERDRIRAEMSAATQEKEEADKEIEDTSRQLETSNREIDEARKTSAASVKTPPTVVSPAPSTSSNPFFRRTADATFSPPIGSPSNETHSHSAFDKIFGPSFSSGTATPAPQTSFNKETGSVPREVSTMSESVRPESSLSSTPTDAIEPPAPPKSRQITSAALPFRVPLERNDSVSSSVRVAPPVSRVSPADSPRVMTPSASTASPSDQPHSQDPFESSTPTKATPVDETVPEQTEAAVLNRDFVPHDTTFLSAKSTHIPGAFPGGETPRSETPGQTFPPAVAAVGAGIATLAAGAGVAGVASNEHDKGKGVEDSTTQAPKEGQSNFDDFFGGPAHQRSKSEQVADFDSAFSNMKNGPTTNGTSNPSQEFPDIQELPDDESSEYSDETPMGFEDDFNAKTPERPSKISEDVTSVKNKQPEVASALPGYLSAQRPPFETASSTTSSLPGIESQASPPTYGDSVPSDNPSHFPPEFEGLLPKREDPTSLPPAGGESSQTAPPSTLPPSYGPEVSRSLSSSKNMPSAAAPSKAPLFDFDSAFAGMGPAQVEEDDEEEQSAMPGKNHMSEFDPTFDTPTQSRSTTAASNIGPMSVYSAVTGGPAQTITQPNARDFDNFDNAFSATQAPPAPQSSSTAPTTLDTSHNWDTMFAGLDSNPTSSISDLRPSSNTQPEASKIATMAPVNLSAETPTSTTTAPLSPSPPSLGTTKPQRPQPGRALSAGTEHDDPILKRLTAMGWSRDDSLKALEQFDYNIDKAADYLTFK